jgi:plastocyanin
LISLPSKLLFALAGVASAGGIVYAAFVGERGGVVLLFAAALVALVMGLGLLVARDTAPTVAAAAPAPDPRATTPGAPAQPSAWPLATAAAAGVVAAGAAFGAPLAYGGIGLAVAAALGWFGKAWSEHPAWTPRVRERVDYRLLVPWSLPVVMAAVALGIAVSMSRVLLAVDKDVATYIAIAVAVALLGGFTLVAARPRVPSSLLVAVAAVLGVAVVGAGIAGAAQGERHFEKHGHEVPEVEIEAENVAFDKDELVVPAEEKVHIRFVNRDDQYHNVAVYESDDPDAKPIFNGDGFVGVDARTYEIKPPESGTYVFVCDFHPNMKGTFVVE